MRNKKLWRLSFLGMSFGIILISIINFFSQGYISKYIFCILFFLLGPSSLASFITDSFLIQDIIIIIYFVFLGILLGRMKKKVLLCSVVLILHIFSALVMIYDFEQFTKGIGKIDWKLAMQEWCK